MAAWPFSRDKDKIQARVTMHDTQLVDAFEGVSVSRTVEPSAKLALPAFEWCDVPTGVVSIEGIIYRIEAFRMAAFLVTHDQYQAFIMAPDGYFNDQWWEDIPDAERPMQPGDQQWPLDGHPREHINWYEAIAFCRWLSHHIGLPIRLPTEQEWQRAAQGDDQRSFPWGDDYDDTSRCNTRERDLRQTSPIGGFPKGISTYGVHDMAGNVWEWCLNEYEHSSRIGLRGTGPRVLRGGSWFSPHDVTHTTFRYFCLPRIRDFDVGFRVVHGNLASQSTVRPDLLLTAASLTRSFTARLMKQIKKIIGL